MFVVKRNGQRVPVSFDQILSRIRNLSNNLEHVNPDLVAQKVCNQLQDGMETKKLDEFIQRTKKIEKSYEEQTIEKELKSVERARLNIVYEKICRADG